MKKSREEWLQLAAELRSKADAARRRAQDSWERSDTDGFLSQWASDLSAKEYDAQASIAESFGMSEFSGLYDGDRRVAAKIIESKFQWRTTYSWLLTNEEAERYGRRFIPVGENSRVQKQLGLKERHEMAPAWAKMTGSGTGLSGSCWIETYRTGDKYGLDAVLADEEVEA